MTDIIANASLPLLGEDYLALKIAASTFDQDIGPSDYQELRSRSKEIKQHRQASSSFDTGIHTIPNASIIKHEHFQDIAETLATFVDQHTDAVEIEGSDWKSITSDLSHILISGDVSSRAYEQMRKAVARQGGLIARLQDPSLGSDKPSTGWVSAVGAAMIAKKRWFGDHVYYLPGSHDEL